MFYKGRRHRRGYGAMSEINVTPFVDVMLVLLVIFMITAPLARYGFDVKLPKVEAGPVTKQETYVIYVHRDMKIMLNDKELRLPALEDKLSKLARLNSEVDVFLRADADLPYGFVMKVMASVRRSGVRNLGMVTEPVPVKK